MRYKVGGRPTQRGFLSRAFGHKTIIVLLPPSLPGQQHGQERGGGTLVAARGDREQEVG